MVDALPYLIDYPYGCTEQTLNRFLPAVITQQTLLRMRLDLKAIQQKRTNLNAQEIGDAAERAKGWKRFDRNPVFDQAELTKIVKAGVNRLQEMQLSDGGWGWFSGWGEQIYAAHHGHRRPRPANRPAKRRRPRARRVGTRRRMAQAISGGATSPAGQRRRRRQRHRQDTSRPSSYADNIDALVYMVLVDAGVKSDTMRDYLYHDRTKLAVYGLATYGLALHKQHEADKLAMVMRNISQYVVEDNENQTAYLNLPRKHLVVLVRQRVRSQRVLPEAARGHRAEEPSRPAAREVPHQQSQARHLLEQHARHGPRHRSAGRLHQGQRRRQAGPDRRSLGRRPEAQGSEDQRRQPVHVRQRVRARRRRAAGRAGTRSNCARSGTGPLYWNGYLTNFTLEDNIRHAGLELKVERHYYKLTPADKSIDVAGGRGQVVEPAASKNTTARKSPIWAPSPAATSSRSSS